MDTPSLILAIDTPNLVIASGSGEVAIDTPNLVIASAAKQSPVATALISGDGRSPRRFAPRDDELVGIGASAGAASAAPFCAFEFARLQWTPQTPSL
jgi:hypothetical protein